MDAHREEPQYTTAEQAEKRLKKFNSRVTHGKNLPPELRPPDGDATRDFANRIIEAFVQSKAEIHGENGIRHKQAMALAAISQAYLDGASPLELKKRITREGIKTRENYERLALGVAGDGARVLRKKAEAQRRAVALTPLASEATSSEHAKPLLEVVVSSEQLSILEEYTDLDDTIKRLYHEGRPQFNATCARGMLLFFGLAHDENASQNAIDQALRNTAGRLQHGVSKLRKAHQEHGDQHLRQGLGYIEAMTERYNPVLLETLIYLESDRRDGGEPAARDYVYSHIAYTLDEMYPAR